jgi:hypothetical protein
LAYFGDSALNFATMRNMGMDDPGETGQARNAAIRSAYGN